MVASGFFLASISLLSSLFVSSTLAAPTVGIEKRAVSRNGEPGLIGSGTYPRATSLKDGSILGCYTAFENGNTILKTARSTNGGFAWTQIGSIASAATATRDLDNCYLHQLPSGRILAAFRNHDRTTAKGPYTLYRITLSYSDTNGASWNFLSQATTSSTPGLGIWEPFMMDAQDGSLMLFYSRETNTNGSDQDNVVIRSSDGGTTFSADTTVSGAGITIRDGMVGVVRTGGSNLLAVFETLVPDNGITSVTSSDDGKTWGNRRVVYKTSVGGANTHAPQVSIVNGKLVTAFMVNEDDTSRLDVKVVTSTNGGASWGEKTTALNACNWPGVLTIDNSHLMVACESGGNSLSQSMNIS